MCLAKPFINTKVIHKRSGDPPKLREKKLVVSVMRHHHFAKTWDLLGSNLLGFPRRDLPLSKGRHFEIPQSNDPKPRRSV